MKAGDQRFRPVPAVRMQPVEAGAVLLNAEAGTVFELNRIGAEIWVDMCAGRSTAEICDGISERYGVDRGRAEVDLRSLIESLVGADLIQET